MPPALASRPKLDYKQRWLYEHFEQVSPDRPIGQVGPLSIPTSEIESHLRLANIGSQDQREQIRRVIRRLDKVFLKHFEDKREADEKAAKAKK